MRASEINPRPHLYLDMDGVQADFFSAWAKLHGKERYKEIGDREARERSIDDLNARGPEFVLEFFKTLPPLPGGQRLIQWLHANKIPFTVLSAPLRGNEEASIAGKRYWLNKYNPGSEPTAIFTGEKQKLAQHNGQPNVLVDDFKKYIRAWSEAGGIPILYRDANADDAIAQLAKIYGIDQAVTNEDTSGGEVKNLIDWIGKLDANIQALLVTKRPDQRDLYYKYKNMRRQAVKKLKRFGVEVQEAAQDNSAVEQYIQDVYAEYPQMWQNNHVMPFSEEEFAMFELRPSASKHNAVDIYWFQAWPQRQGVGSRALKVLQDKANKYGVALTLVTWDKGRVSQAALTRFYKRAGFKQSARGARNMSWEPITEINDDDELSISQRLEDYFYKRGYRHLGEGRDQIAFLSPRNTVVKVLGIGDHEREKIVRDYVAYFERNQHNPYYPKIYNSGEFTLEGETYFIYEQEYLQYVANEEATLDYLEKLMSAMERDLASEFIRKNPLPSELDINEIEGLIINTEQMIQALGGQAPLDLSQIENLRRRESDGHIVIMDPYSL